MSKKDTRLHYGDIHPTVQWAQPVVGRREPKSTLVEDQEGYVPPEDRITIRGELHQWSLVDPVAYKAYLKALGKIDDILKNSRVEISHVRRSIERMVERTRAAYPGE